MGNVIRRISKIMIMILITILLINISTEAEAGKRPNRPKSQKGNAYWHMKKKTATGRHSYYKAGFGYYNTCATYSTHLPRKNKCYKRLKRQRAYTRQS